MGRADSLTAAELGIAGGAADTRAVGARHGEAGAGFGAIDDATRDAADGAADEVADAAATEGGSCDTAANTTATTNTRPMSATITRQPVLSLDG
jgi:hypothetical protein